MKPLSRSYLLLECLLIFGGVPLLILFIQQRALMFVLLWVGAFFAIHTLMKQKPGWSLKSEWNHGGFRKESLLPMLVRFAIIAVLLSVFTYVVEYDKLLSFPRERPATWLMVMTLYPLLSVFPQEMIFRTFFFHRYRALFPNRHAEAIASSIAFGYAHIFFHNWIAVVFSACGGLLFAQTYRKRASLGLVCLEHALYGCFVFTIGLGAYFYSAANWR